MVLPTASSPLFIEEARHIALSMTAYTAGELADMLHVNPQIAARTCLQFRTFHDEGATGLPALSAYTGMVFRHIAPQDFTAEDWAYAQSHLFITSFLYGLLRPADRIRNYRLEGHVRLPEKEDRTMLLRRRISRIFYLKKFFDYPVTFNAKTILNLGLGRTVRAAIGYLRATLSKRPELSLQDFYINRFGRPLYKMFFEHYTEKVWGVHPSVLGADWGAQRVNGLSIKALLKNMLVRKKRTPGDIRQKDTEKSLIENFLYPKFGPGQLWETAAQEIERDDKGTILLMHRLVGIHYEDGLIRSITAATPDGHVDIPCDYVLSSMPVKDLVSTFTGITVPPEVFSVATSLPYRDFITVGILVDRLKIRHNGQPPTFGNRIPDTWIYIQERDVRIGRLQVFNNWSPYLVEDYRNCIWLGLEYFCNENDELWNKTDRDFISMAIGELVHIGILEDETHVKDSTIVREKKAYPAYHGSYRRLKEVTDWLDHIPNLYCIGRNGQHRYNNMDHSMLTAIEAVNAIKAGSTDKTAIWNVNTEKEYHEEKEA